MSHNWKNDEITLVINQDSRRALQRAKELQSLAKEHHIRTVICSGADLEYTIRIELQNKKLKRLVIGGGDGSVALAASMIVRTKRRIELAIIPVGTANYYVHTLGIKTISEAFKAVVGGKVEPRYVCTANDKVFLMVANIGVTSRMLHEVSDESKKRLGKLAYVLGIAKLFFTFDPMRVTIKTKGKKVTYATTELHVINQSVGDKFKLHPQVDSTEPYFEIVTFGLKNTKLSPLFAALIFIFTFGRNQNYLKRIKATEATIKTDRKEVFSLDGDSIGNTPITVKMVEKPLYFVSG